MVRKKHTAEADRHAAAEDEGRLRQFLEQAGTGTIHTVNSVAEVLFGHDGCLLPRQRKSARRWIEKLQNLRYPLYPCDEHGTLLSDKQADDQARRGFARRWRYFPDGRWASEFGEALDSDGRADFADGVVALEQSNPPEIFDEPRSRLLEGLRAILTLDEYRAAERRFETARTVILNRHRSSLVNQLARTKGDGPAAVVEDERLGFVGAATQTMGWRQRRA